MAMYVAANICLVCWNFKVCQDATFHVFMIRLGTQSLGQGWEKIMFWLNLFCRHKVSWKMSPCLMENIQRLHFCKCNPISRCLVRKILSGFMLTNAEKHPDVSGYTLTNDGTSQCPVKTIQRFRTCPSWCDTTLKIADVAPVRHIGLNISGLYRKVKISAMYSGN